jgi:hypothetical protein
MYRGKACFSTFQEFDVSLFNEIMITIRGTPNIVVMHNRAYAYSLSLPLHDCINDVFGFASSSTSNYGNLN